MSGSSTPRPPSESGLHEFWLSIMPGNEHTGELDEHTMEYEEYPPEYEEYLPGLDEHISEAADPVSMAVPITEEEAKGYYVGLASCPKLVARSNANEPWSERQDFWTVRKTIDPIGNHAIIPLWNIANSSLRQAIIATLKDINWTAIDILRVGYSRRLHTVDEPDDMFPKLLISVQPESTTWEVGFDVTLRCRHVLQQHGVNDTEVEIMEACVSMSNIPKLTSQPITEEIQESAQLSEFIGTSIASEASPKGEGTKGFYVRLKETGKLLFVTCRHVILPGNVANVDYHHNDNTPIMVVQPGERTYPMIIGYITARITSLQDDIYNLVQGERDELNRLQDMLATFDKLRDLKSRIIGHVLFSPKYGCGFSESGAELLRDWALVEPHQDRHETVFDEIKNRVVAGPGANRQRDRFIIQELSADQRGEFKNQLLIDHHTKTYELSRTVQGLETRWPFHVAQSIENENAMLVAKFGRSTGLTFGVANEVQSVRRQVFDKEIISEEWCMLGTKKKGECRTLFSAPGDSGSCILDMYGRIAGMVTAGKDIGDGRPDTTYATPIEWLLADIRKCGFDVTLA
ncbi:hypothetical protein FBEOM_2717 [Fusarium beomiforme]|uniref:Serine protease n=1 Tax=Fusarium beomiforme TaxID=44412 RepID=A0A9P5ARB0_9HYPO|nr:hypothetical protein FBEOM_2717 [Fusarium beomiforme]